MDKDKLAEEIINIGVRFIKGLVFEEGTKADALNLIDKIEKQAINYNGCCKSDSEQLVCTYCGINPIKETCQNPKKCSSKEKIKAN